jgi:hypothetical protein
LINVPVIVQDNNYGEDGIDTFFCLEGQGVTCNYPNVTIEGLRVDLTGDYMLKYFSRDDSRNYEVVKEIEIFLENVTIPELDSVTWVPR